MAEMKCYNTTEKGLSQGCYGGNGNWGRQKKENRYQEHQNGYAMYNYSECETFSQQQNGYPTHGMSKHQAAYGKADTWDGHGYGRSNGYQKPQNGSPFKPQVPGHGNGYGNHSSGNGMLHMQAPDAGKHQGTGYGYGGSALRAQKVNGGMGHGFSSHTDYAGTYGCEETNGGRKFSNNGMMAYGQAPLHGKHSGQGNGIIQNHQANYGPGRNMGYESSETCEYSSEKYYSKESHNYGGSGGVYRAGKDDHPVKGLLRKIKGSISSNKSCSDNDSDSDHSEEECETKMQQVWISKAI